MVDPITSADFKRRQRMEDYQNYLDTLDDLVGGDTSLVQPMGKMEGKSVKILEDASPLGNIFKNSFNKS